MVEALKDKRVLVVGASGQVGRALARELTGCCELVTAARHGACIDLDLVNKEQIVSVMTEVEPEIVINAAAYTQVDKAEDEPELARMINAVAPGVMAEQCKKIGAALIHYSTDYVFSGTGDKLLTEDAPVSPINVYGETKLEGERAIQAVDCNHLIFRTCWVYDGIGKNFLNTIIRAACSQPVLQVVDDQYGTPTSARFIARVTRESIKYCVSRDAVYVPGSNRVYNLTARGYTTWYGFAEKIVEALKHYKQANEVEVLRVGSDQYPTIAKRPKWSVLNIQKLCNDFDVNPASWDVLAQRCLEQKYHGVNDE